MYGGRSQHSEEAMEQQNDDHHAEAERHVREGEERVACQEKLVAELRADGRATSEAKHLLAGLTGALAVMREHLRYERAQRGLA
jgi:hypothetical protein